LCKVQKKFGINFEKEIENKFLKKNYSVSIKTLLNISLQTKTVQFGRFECVVGKKVISQWKPRNNYKKPKTLKKLAVSRI
jgi:hypothetical protein